MSAAEVESLVTAPLEQALSGVEGLDILRSKSAPQVSAIKLIFKSDVAKYHQKRKKRAYWTFDPYACRSSRRCG